MMIGWEVFGFAFFLCKKTLLKGMHQIRMEMLSLKLLTSF